MVMNYAHHTFKTTGSTRQQSTENLNDNTLLLVTLNEKRKENKY